MDINETNCTDYYRVVDYLHDDITMNRIVNFINQNITFENSIDLMQLTNKFDQSIETLYSEKDVNGQEMTTLINFVKKVSTSESATFIKVIQNLCKQSSSSACVDILKVYLTNQVIRSTSCKSDVSKIISQIKCLFSYCSSQDKFSIYNQCLDIISAKNEEVPVSIYKDIFTSNQCYLRLRFFIDATYTRRRNISETRIRKDTTTSQWLRCRATTWFIHSWELSSFSC